MWDMDEYKEITVLCGTWTNTRRSLYYVGHGRIQGDHCTKWDMDEYKEITALSGT